MATVNYDLNSSLHFPPLSKRYTVAKQHQKKRKSKRHFNHDNNVEIRSRIDELNDTLLELIFINLFSWKYLVRSKVVSKRWNSIISNLDFVRTLTKENYPFTLFLRRKNEYHWQEEYLVDSHLPDVRNHKLLLDFFPDYYFGVTDIVVGQTYYDNWQEEYLIVSEHPDIRNHKLHPDFFPDDCFGVTDVVGQNNDVLVFRRILIELEEEEVELYVVNPFTKQYVVVFPKPAVERIIESVIAIGITGFVDGVSSVTATSNPQDTKRGFRIVEVIKQRPKTLVLRNYSSKTSQWTIYLYDDFFESSIWYEECNHAITLNNKVHWLFMPLKILVIDPFNIDIVPPHTLDLCNEIDRVISLYDHSFVLDVCQNQLRIAVLQQNKADGDYTRIKVWEIEDYKDYDNIAKNNYMAKLRLVIDVSMNRSIIERELPPIHRRLYPKRYSYYDCYCEICNSSTRNKVICCHPNDPHVVYFVYDDVLYYYDDLKKICKVVSHCSSNCSSNWSHRFVFMHPSQI